MPAGGPAFQIPHEMSKRLFGFLFVRDGKLLTATLTASRKYTTAVRSFHTLPETMLVLSAAIRGLEGPFHNEISFLVLKIRTAKVIKLLNAAN